MQYAVQVLKSVLCIEAQILLHLEVEWKTLIISF